MVRIMAGECLVKIENTTKTADISVRDDAAPTIRFDPSISELRLVSNRVQVYRQLHDIDPSARRGTFDIKRVEELKKAISEGRFVTDPEKIADGLLDTVNGLLPRKCP
jgi:negative regulator of flagellin synthesis FlgM